MTAVLEKAALRGRRLWRACVCELFGLDPWHGGLPSERRYPADIAAHLNGRTESLRCAAFEIGCGLCDISRELDFASVSCFDRDSGVLRAARLLSLCARPGAMSFARLDFPSGLPSGKADAVILVNWIHHVEPRTLRNAIKSLFESNLKPGGELIFDTVSDPAYEYNHDAAALSANLGAELLCLGSYDRGRKVFSLVKHL